MATGIFNHRLSPRLQANVPNAVANLASGANVKTDVNAIGAELMQPARHSLVTGKSHNQMRRGFSHKAHTGNAVAEAILH